MQKQSAYTIYPESISYAICTHYINIIGGWMPEISLHPAEIQGEEPSSDLTSIHTANWYKLPNDHFPQPSFSLMGFLQPAEELPKAFPPSKLPTIPQRSPSDPPVIPQWPSGQVSFPALRSPTLRVTSDPPAIPQ